MADLARLQKILGYQFDDPKLLELALTHRSMGNRNNERLEFLGDSILNHIIAEDVFRRFPKAREGELSRMRAAIVRKETLALVAGEFALGEYLRLGAGERKSGGHRRASILADALESVLGAILLDSGVDACRHCVLVWFDEPLQALAEGSAAKDSKTELQEYLQGRSGSLPEYELLEVQGQPHDQSFRVACRLRQPELVVEGSGKSRRKAEQVAASHALEKLAAHDR
tara:strand:+ start:280 stop:960 length:681 start_codon:yes stop_codon:yes gene_type:complete